MNQTISTDFFNGHNDSIFDPWARTPYPDFNRTVDMGQLRSPVRPRGGASKADLDVSVLDVSVQIDPDTWHRLSDEEREEVLRRRRKEDAYKTALCKNYREGRACEYGDSCRFAHGVNELRLPKQPRGRSHPKYKTQLCDKFTATGMCPYGSRCQFIHTKNIHPEDAPLKLEFVKPADRTGGFRTQQPPVGSFYLPNGIASPDNASMPPTTPMSQETASMESPPDSVKLPAVRETKKLPSRETVFEDLRTQRMQPTHYRLVSGTASSRAFLYERSHPSLTITTTGLNLNKSISRHR